MNKKPAILYTRPLKHGQYRIEGIVDGERRSVIVSFDGEPTEAAIEKALRKGTSEAVKTEEPAPPPEVTQPAAPPAEKQGAAGNQSPPPPPADVPAEVAALLAMSVDDIKLLVSESEDVEFLTGALEAEQAEGGANRKTAREALEARIAALQAKAQA